MRRSFYDNAEGDALAAPPGHFRATIPSRWRMVALNAESGYGRGLLPWRGNGGSRLAYHIYKNRSAFSSKSVVRHSCDNRKCVNPDHLIYGTQADNIADMVGRQRGLVGELNNSAK